MCIQELPFRLIKMQQLVFWLGAAAVKLCS